MDINVNILPVLFNINCERLGFLQGRIQQGTFINIPVSTSTDKATAVLFGFWFNRLLMTIPIPTAEGGRKLDLFNRRLYQNDTKLRVRQGVESVYLHSYIECGTV